MVWLYTKRAVKALMDTLADSAASVPAQTLDAEFGSSLMAELDSVLADGSAESKPASPPARSPSQTELEAQDIYGDEQDRELLDFESAVAKGIIPPELDS